MLLVKTACSLVVALIAALLNATNWGTVIALPATDKVPTAAVPIFAVVIAASFIFAVVIAASFIFAVVILASAILAVTTEAVASCAWSAVIEPAASLGVVIASSYISVSCIRTVEAIVPSVLLKGPAIAPVLTNLIQ